jgi:hypothetical protein
MDTDDGAPTYGFAAVLGMLAALASFAFGYFVLGYGLIGH